MTKNTSIDNHYYNEFDITEKNIYNRLLVDSQFRYLNYAQNGTNNHNGTFGFTEYFPSYATVYYVQGRVATPGQANAAIVKAFDFSINHLPFYIYEVINNYNMYLYPSSQSYKLLKCNNSTQIDSKVYDNYKSAGMLHILTVSGLHVGVFASIISFILKKLKANKWVNFVITSIILLFFKS